MPIPKEHLETIKAKVPLSRVVSDKVELRRKGKVFMGLSPFNDERTPSFQVDDRTGLWCDFSGGGRRGGDHITFLRDVMRMSFVEAVARLSDLAGVPMPQGAVRGGPDAHPALTSCLADAGRWFRARLADDDGAMAMDWLAYRGVPLSTIAELGIGYAPDHPGLVEHLLGKGHLVGTMRSAGLVTMGDAGSMPLLRKRVVFPIRDGAGRTVSFAGRLLGAGRHAKYVNGPTTAVFEKGNHLYGMDLAALSRHRQPLVAVEGYMDTAALRSVGWERVVSPMGVELNDRQLAAMWRMDDVPVLLFDGNKAGYAGMERAIEIAFQVVRPGKGLRVGLLPDGLDPDDLVRERGLEGVREAVRRSRTLFDAFWHFVVGGADMGDPASRAAVHARFRNMVGIIEDTDVRDQYVHDFERRLREFSDAGYGRSVVRLARWVLDECEDIPDDVAAFAEAVMDRHDPELDRRIAGGLPEPDPAPVP